MAAICIGLNVLTALMVIQQHPLHDLPLHIPYCIKSTYVDQSTSVLDSEVFWVSRRLESLTTQLSIQKLIQTSNRWNFTVGRVRKKPSGDWTLFQNTIIREN